MSNLLQFWSLDAQQVLDGLEVSAGGLTTDEAHRRLAIYGPNLATPRPRSHSLALLLAQLKSPIILILIAAVIASFFLGDRTDAIIILAIIAISALLGFWQERGATRAVEKLLALVETRATVLRDGRQQEIPAGQIVPGDILLLSAGQTVPGDGLVIQSKDLFMDEAMLTGETYPVEKTAAISPADAPLSRRTNAVFMGTHVVSGSAQAVVVHTGKATEFGRVSERLGLRPMETEFERGIRHFGYLLMEVTLFLVITILVVNVYFNRPVLDSLLFSLALAVGLTPQLLPAIISVNLSYGAKRLAESKVIVKRLASIENFGSMNVLCCDKTGTLTEGKVRWQSALSVDGQESHKARLYAYLNAFHESGFGNPIDEAIRADAPQDISAYGKLDEVPYDFVRKRQSILVRRDGASLMTTKGALQNMLAVCFKAETADGASVDISSVAESIQRQFEELSAKGLRVLGLGYRELTVDAITRDHESGMTFLGLLVFFDPPKVGVDDTIRGLKALGVNMKIITGDNRLVAATLAQELGLRSDAVMTGAELRRTGDEALMRQVGNTDIFAETEPNQKERIIQALKHAGNVVGFMGDGINDASALHAADVGISVDTAADVAKETADIVLLEKNLDVLLQGVKVGRATFANTLKYVFMATSANFGNMFSMAGASLFLKYLPLLPQQVLLTNLMTDIPEMTIATDSVDPELVDVPRRWNVAFIRRFMIVFGLLSALFDFATFGVLLVLLNATTDQFRAGWFVESVVSACLTVLVIRSRRPFFRSKPGSYLILATMVISMIAVALPFTPVGKAFGFHPFPVVFLAYLLAIVVLYMLMAEVIKRRFYRWNVRDDREPRSRMASAL